METFYKTFSPKTFQSLKTRVTKLITTLEWVSLFGHNLRHTFVSLM